MKVIWFIKNYCLVMIMDKFVLRLDKAKKAIDEYKELLFGDDNG